MKGVEQPPQFHPEGDVWIHTLMMLGGSAGRMLADPGLGRPAARCWQAADVQAAGRAGRAHSLRRARGGGRRMAEEICRRLRFSNEDTEQIASLVANHMRFKDVAQMKTSTLKRFVRLESIRRASGVAPPGLPLEPRQPGGIRLRAEVPGRDPAGAGAAGQACRRATT